MTFPRIYLRLVTLAFAGLFAQAVVAQETPDTTISDPVITLELNNASNTGNSGCQMTFVVTNHGEKGLAEVAYQVGVFDAKGIVRRILVLEFGSLIGGKTKIALFNLADQPCSDISRIIVNDVAQCTLAENSKPADFCLSGLLTRSRSDIEFGL